MQFGVTIPHRGPLAKPDAVRAIVAKAEACGFDYISVSDHILVPRDIASRYPYSETGEFTGGGSGESLEQFSMLAYLAGISKTARLLTSVTVVPHRRPEFMAKAIATIDQLSGGRVTMGCGVGWMKEEFEAIGAPPFEERGRASDEYLNAMKVLWTQADPKFEGKFVNFSNIVFEPKPVQTPHPPIWIGGESGPAIRRAVTIGDGWYPFATNPRYRMDTYPTLEGGLERMRAAADKAGRDPATVALTFNVSGCHNETEGESPDGGRQIMSGTAAQRVEDVKRLAGMGFSILMVALWVPDLDRTLARMERFAAEVMEPSR